jgi:hypothetical protein
VHHSTLDNKNTFKEIVYTAAVRQALEGVLRGGTRPRSCNGRA